MSDVEDELLALAGGGDSSDDDEGHDDNGSRSSGRRSPSPPPARNGQSKGVATKKVPAKKSAKRRAPAVDSDDEGEASDPGSPSSVQSAAMDISDSDDDDSPSKPDADDEDNKYPIDGLFTSIAEKEEIMSMREMEREQILAERGAEKDRIQQNKLLRQLVNNEEQRNKKRTAEAADLDDDDGPRKTSRARTKVGGTKVGETNSGIDTLKNRRAEKSERDRRREEGRDNRRGSVISERSRSDRDRRSPSRDSDVAWHESKEASKQSEESKPAELQDIERIRVGRSRFGGVLFWPGMEEAMVGSFVRVSIGINQETGENMYRAAVVKAITVNKARPYAFMGPKGTEVVTDSYATAAHGKSARDFPFIACSDSPFTEAEWSRYVRVCEAENVSIPKKGATFKIADGLQALLNRQLTNEDINNKIKKQNEIKAAFKGYTKNNLEYDLSVAKRFGNTEKVAEAQSKIDNYVAPRLCYRTSLPSEKKKPIAETEDIIAKMNENNRRKNDEEVRAALIRERKKQKEHAAAGDKAKPPDSTPNSANGTPNPKTSAEKPVAHTPHIKAYEERMAKEGKKGMTLLHKPVYDDDVIASMELGIDDDLDAM